MIEMDGADYRSTFDKNLYYSTGQFAKNVQTLPKNEMLNILYSFHKNL